MTDTRNLFIRAAVVISSLSIHTLTDHTSPYPAVLLVSSINLHVAAVARILQQAIVLKEQPGAFAETLALVVVVLLDKLLHQLEQTFWVPGIPLDQMLG